MVNHLDWSLYGVETPASSKLLSNAGILMTLLVLKKSFKDIVIKWKNKTYEDIFEKKKRILARLNGIQSSPSYQMSFFVKDIKFKLQLEYNNILKMEQDFRKFHSRITWLNDGDPNPKFYYIMSSNRKRRNAITYFANGNGN